MDRKLEALRKILEIIDRLRGPGGCPWDRSRKLEDMGRYLTEEVAEAVDAIEDGGGAPTARVCEELGDVLMNLLLAARIAEDEGGFDAADVANRIAEKLVRRHPHVFGAAHADGVEDVVSNWETIKNEEASEDGSPPRKSRLDSVPRNLPLLERAREIGRAAALDGFDWPDPEGALEKVAEEFGEVRAALERARASPGGISGEAGRELLQSELGDLLFAVTNLCRKLDISPEASLRRTLKKFRDRFEAVERTFPDLRAATLEDMEAVWQAAKKAGDSGSLGPAAEGETP
ncbi:MAG: nucleoside triphosphate pyrophosphohydrolase [Planctomycetota bacterium]